MKDLWLTNKGVIIEVGDAQHNNYAHDLLKDEMGWKVMYDYMKENNFSYPYEVLHDRGWVRIKSNTHYLPRIEILGGCISLVKPMKNTIDPAMNSRQIKIAKRICEENNTSFHEAINDKRFW